jgi:hypothetical protein
MNIEFIQCKDIGDTMRQRSVDGLKKGLSDIYNRCYHWMDGWQLEVYKTTDFHPSCDDQQSFLDSCNSFLANVGEDEPIAYHFLHKCGDSWRDGVTTWD